MMNAMGQVLDQISALAQELKLETLQPHIAACRQLLEARNGLEVAVFGRFKAGKSSFLNDLAGRTVLPIGVVPVTAVITRLRYGPRDRAQVHFQDGRVQEIALADVPLYVSENENPQNLRQVATVEIEVPELQAYAPLEFVDTPGLDSAFEHNTEAALSWLPRAAVALVAVSADAPLSQRDLAVLDELRRSTPQIVLLLTKADLLTEVQREEVRTFVAGQLQQRWKAAPPVFLYSVRPELAALKTRLQNELLEPLQRRSRQTGSAILQHKLASLRSLALDYLRVALAAATRTETARTALRQRLLEERRQFNLLRAELSLFPHQAAARALDDYLERLRPMRRILQGNMTAELGDQLAHWHMPLPRLLEAWRAWLRAWLHRELTKLSEQQRPMFCAPLEQTRTHLVRMLRSFHDRLAAHVQDALGLPLTTPEISLEFVPPSSPPLDVAYAFDVSFSMLAWLIPVRPFRRWIHRALLRKARYEVEKNLSRLAADWRERTQQVMLELCGRAEAMARAQLDALEGLLAQTASDAPRLRQQIRELESLPLVDGQCPASHAVPHSNGDPAGDRIAPVVS